MSHLDILVSRNTVKWTNCFVPLFQQSNSNITPDDLCYMLAVLSRILHFCERWNILQRGFWRNLYSIYHKHSASQFKCNGILISINFSEQKLGVDLFRNDSRLSFVAEKWFRQWKTFHCKLINVPISTTKIESQFGFFAISVATIIYCTF